MMLYSLIKLFLLFVRKYFVCSSVQKVEKMCEQEIIKEISLHIRVLVLFRAQLGCWYSLVIFELSNIYCEFDQFLCFLTSDDTIESYNLTDRTNTEYWMMMGRSSQFCFFFCCCRCWLQQSTIQCNTEPEPFI
jgi:hypothetical protein